MLKLTYSYICNACEQRIVKEYELLWWWEKLFPFPVVPDGWVKIEEKIFCPRHEVEWIIRDATVNTYEP